MSATSISPTLASSAGGHIAHLPFDWNQLIPVICITTAVILLILLWFACPAPGGRNSEFDWKHCVFKLQEGTHGRPLTEGPVLPTVVVKPKAPANKNDLDISLKKAAEEGDIKRVGELLQAGATTAAIDCRVFELAVKNNRVELVRILLEHHANANITNVDDESPLYFAALHHKTSVARALLEHGADQKIKNTDNRMAIHLAAWNNYVAVVRVLLEHDGNVVNARGHRDRTPLHYAAMQSKTDVVRLLLYSGADTKLKDEDGSTALNWAAWKNHADVVRVLLEEHGEDINVKDNKGRTPLHDAASNGATDAVRLLLEKGADRSIKDKDGKTALDLARDKDDGVIVQLLSD